MGEESGNNIVENYFLWYRNNFPKHLTKIFLMSHKESKILWARKSTTHLKLLLKNGLILDNYLYLTSGKITSFLFLQNMHTPTDLGIKGNFIINISPHPFRKRIRVSISPKIFRRNTYMEGVLRAIDVRESILYEAFKKEGRVRVDFIRIIGERTDAGINLRLASLIEEIPVTSNVIKSFLTLLEILKEGLGAEYLQAIPEKYINVWEF